MIRKEPPRPSNSTHDLHNKSERWISQHILYYAYKVYMQRVSFALTCVRYTRGYYHRDIKIFKIS